MFEEVFTNGLLLGILWSLLDIKSKLSKIINHPRENSKKVFPLKDYLHKMVSLYVNYDELKDYKKFSLENRTFGEIIDFDDEWLAFKYYDTFYKKTYIQYLHIKDIAGIEEKNN